MNDVELLGVIEQLRVMINDKSDYDDRYEPPRYYIEIGYIEQLERTLFDMYVKKVRSKKHE